MIAAGGIGGLTLALSLQRIGIPVFVFEGVALVKAARRRHQLLPHAVCEKPNDGPPIWSGRILWRGITAGEALLSGCSMIMAAPTQSFRGWEAE